jgi:uncharacterized membrane protein YfcA
VHAPFESLALTGLAIGVVVGLTGVGGGSLMTPLLVTVFGIPAPVAVGTDLACAAITKSVGTVAHRAARTIVPGVVLRLVAGSVPAALVTLIVLSQLDVHSPALDHAIRIGVAGALLLSIAALLLRSRLRRWAQHSPFLQRHRAQRGAFSVLAGAIIGAAVAFTSLGAGAIGAACLALLYPELDAAEIAGSDIAHAVPLTAIAAVGHAWLGTVDVTLLLGLVAGGIPGIVIGSLATRRVPRVALRTLLLGTLALAAAKLLI